MPKLEGTYHKAPTKTLLTTTTKGDIFIHLPSNTELIVNKTEDHLFGLDKKEVNYMLFMKNQRSAGTAWTEDLLDPTRFKYVGHKDFFAQNSSVNWLTPPEIIEAAKKALGTIELDPCPSTDPKNWFATENWSLGGPVDSLRTNWTIKGQPATVFVNPPFGVSYVNGEKCISSEEHRESQDKEVWGYKELEFKDQWQRQTLFMWAQKCIQEHSKGCEIIWLSKAAIENSSLQLLLQASGAICFPSGRVCYINPTTLEEAPQPTFGSIILWLGHTKFNQEEFVKAFSPLGVCKRLA